MSYPVNFNYTVGKYTFAFCRLESAGGLYNSYISLPDDYPLDSDDACHAARKKLPLWIHRTIEAYGGYVCIMLQRDIVRLEKVTKTLCGVLASVADEHIASVAAYDADDADALANASCA